MPTSGDSNARARRRERMSREQEATKRVRLVSKTAGAAVEEASVVVEALRAELERVRVVAHQAEMRRAHWVAVLAYVIREHCGNRVVIRSEEHTSELQSLAYLLFPLLL